MEGPPQGRGTLAVLAGAAVLIVVALAAGLGFDPRTMLAPFDPVRAPPAPPPSSASNPPPSDPAPQVAENPRSDPAPAPPPGSRPEAPAPSFDVVRVEPNGESVIAGRSVAGATIEMLRDGLVHSRTAADQSGLFAFVPPPLQPGSHQVTLQAIAPDGTRQRSRDSVTIVVSEGGNTRPLVALTSPDKPTVLLSNPEAPEPKSAQTSPENRAAEAKAAQAQAGAPKATQAQQQAAVQPGIPAPGPGAEGSQEPQRPPVPSSGGPTPPRPEVKITTVEAEDGGRLYVSGQAAPGSTVRLYLNETLIAPGGAGADGKVSFAIGRGVRPGDYRVRIDDVDPVSGAVKSRAEVVFNVPAPVASAPPQTSPSPGAPQVPAAPQAHAPSGPALAQAPPPPGSPSSAAAAESVLRPPAPGGGPAAASTPRTDVAQGQPRAGSSQVASAATPEVRDLPPGTIVVPDITTAIVSRGDNLWRISQRIYGKGVRYTVIYGANQGQIRNPNLIYPGQVFVLPESQAPKER